MTTSFKAELNRCVYDLTGIVGLEYNNNKYYYVKNLEDDIIGIVNSNNERIVNYEYDSWGKLLCVKDNNGNVITDNNHIGIINPFRYRSYYYDNETGLYYLNSRYYNPEWKRFISADGIIGSNQDLNSYNLYAYCSNNPINHFDDNGSKKKKKKSKKKKKKNILSSIVKAVVSTSTIAIVAKAVITVASNIFLGLKKYDVSRDMFNKSIYYPSGNISKNTQNQIANKSKNSPQVQSAIKSCIAKNNSNNFSHCFGYNDAEMTGDLFYSLQHVDIYVSGKKVENNIWDITIHLSDIYDFTEFRPSLSFSDSANNLGFIMQATGLLQSYTWSVSYNMKYTEEE